MKRPKTNKILVSTLHDIPSLTNVYVHHRHYLNLKTQLLTLIPAIKWCLCPFCCCCCFYSVMVSPHICFSCDGVLVLYWFSDSLAFFHWYMRTREKPLFDQNNALSDITDLSDLLVGLLSSPSVDEPLVSENSLCSESFKCFSSFLPLHSSVTNCLHGSPLYGKSMLRWRTLVFPSEENALITSI